LIFLCFWGFAENTNYDRLDACLGMLSKYCFHDQDDCSRGTLMNLKGLFKSKITRNAGWLIGGNVVYKLIAFVVGIWIARYLGPSNYGLINYASAYLTFFFSLSTLGLNSIIVKEFIDHPEEEGKTLGTTLGLQGVSSLFSSVMIILIVYFIDYGETETLVIAGLSSIGLFFQMMDSLKYWFQSKLMSKYCAIATTLAYIISSLYKVVLLILGVGVRWFALATSIDYLFVALILFYIYKKKGGPRLAFSLAKAKSMLGKSYHYILSGLMVAVYGATDKLMLKQFMNEAEVAYYGTALSICNVWVFVLAAIVDSFNPVILELKNKSQLSYERKNVQLYSIIFYCSMFVGILYTIFAKFGINLLYGNEYMPAVTPLRIITWYVAFSYLGVARSAWIVSENKQRYLIPINAGSAIMNVALNAVLIPNFGAAGAAFASLLTQISTIFVVPLFIREMRPNVRLMLDAVMLKGIKKRNE